jgi:hypothetical protein
MRRFSDRRDDASVRDSSGRFLAAALLPAVVATLLMSGCHRSPDAQSAAVERTTEENAPQAPPATPKPPHEQSPAAQLRHVLEDIASGEVDDIAAALPASYRDDLDWALGVRLKPIAPDVRRDAAQAVAALAKTLIDKERFVLASDRFGLAGPAAPFVREHFAAICRVIVAVARWPGWVALDVPSSSELLAEAARAISVEPSLVGALRAVRIEDGTETGEVRQIILRAGSAKEAHSVPVEQVEDRWLPKSLVERWSALFGHPDSEAAAAKAEQREAQLRELTSQLRDVDRALAAVTTQAEFDALAEKASTLLLATAAQAERRPRTVRSDEFVTVIVTGTLSEDQKDRIVWELASHSDEPSSGLAEAADERGGQFTVAVGPVNDLEAFARRLPGLRLENIDARAKKITARLAAP